MVRFAARCARPSGRNTFGMDATTRTAEGLEPIMATNYLGHFLLTELCLAAMRRAADEEAGREAEAETHVGTRAGAASHGATGRRPVRVVCLSSVTHRSVAPTVDFGASLLSPHASRYALSKLALTLYAYALQRRFNHEGRGDRLQAVAVNPGGVMSDIWRYMPGVLHCVAQPVGRCLLLTPAQGAATSIAGATSRDLEGGEYLSPYRVYDCSPHLFDSLGPFAGAT